MRRLLAQSAASQICYTIIRQLVFLPAVYKTDEAVYVQVMIILLASDILINTMAASFTDKYTRDMQGVSNNNFLFQSYYSLSQILVFVTGLLAYVFLEDVILSLLFTFYLHFYAKALFVQKYKMNEGILNAGVIDLTCRSLAILSTLAVVHSDIDFFGEAQILLFMLCVFQYSALRIYQKLWGFNKLTIDFSLIKVSQFRGWMGFNSLFLTYILMAVIMRGEALLIGFFYNSAPAIFVYYSIISLLTYPILLISGGPFTNYYASLGSKHVKGLLLAAVISGLAYSFFMAFFVSGIVVGLLYEAADIPPSSILAVTVFFIVIAGVLRPLMILTSDVLTLNVLLFLASAGFIAINFLKIIDYEYLFFISAVLKFVCVAGSVLKRES